MQPQFSVNPMFIARIGGLPFSALSQLRHSSLIARAVNLSEARRQLSLTTDCLSKELYEAIGKARDARARHGLVAVRRDIFNGRAVTHDRLHLATLEVDAQVQAAIGQQQQMARLVEALQREFEDEHARLLAESRRHLKRAAAEEDFRAGVLVSSAALFMNLARHSRTADHDLSSRDDRLERGILRYLTRASAKATPFARFCAVLPGIIDDGLEEEWLWKLEGVPTEKVSLIRVNKALCGMLWRHLSRRKELRDDLRVVVNPTMRRDNSYRFIAAIEGKEVFQSLETSEAIESVLSMVPPASGIRIRDLAERLLGHEQIDATADEVHEFIATLVTHGLLCLDSGVSEQDLEWHLTLDREIAASADPHAVCARNLLQRTAAIATAFQTASAVARQGLLDELRSAATDCATELGINERLTSGVLLYEDATARAQMRIAGRGEVRAVLRALESLISRVVPFARLRAEQATMRSIFDGSHGAKTDSTVPLLDFFELYYREHYRDHLRFEAELARGRVLNPDYDFRNPLKLDLVSRIIEADRSVTRLISERWAAAPDAHEIHITEMDLDTILAQLPPDPVGLQSAAVFGEFTGNSESGARFTLSKPWFSGGHGKYFSRFLPLLPPEYLESVRTRNRTAHGAVLAELEGDSHFNANLHPPLMQATIAASPTGTGGQRTTIPVANLRVRPAQGDPHRLEIVHADTGVRVIPTDLAFLGSQHRPPLYRFLSRFSTFNGGGFRLPDFPALPSMQCDRTSVRHRPRIVYERRVVIARRRWIVPAALVPSRATAETDADYFLRVWRWREQHAIDPQVFIRFQMQSANSSGVPAAPVVTDAGEHVRPPEQDVIEVEGDITEDDALEDPEEADPAAQTTRATRPQDARPITGRSRDDHRPQYMDFEAPLLVRLFSRILPRHDRWELIIEERMPLEKDLLQGDGGSYASEVVLEFNAGRDAAVVDQARASEGVA